MSDPTNEDRAGRARHALSAYIHHLSLPPDALEDLDTGAQLGLLVDLIADSMHLFGHEAVENAFNLATIHHHAESTEDPE